VDILFCEGCITGRAMGVEGDLWENRRIVAEYTRKRFAEVKRQGRFKTHAGYQVLVKNTVEAPESERWVATVEQLIREHRFTRTWDNKHYHKRIPGEEELHLILAQDGRHSLEDELNCRACGYRTCRERAVAVHNEEAEPEGCIIHSRQELVNLLNAEGKALECLVAALEARDPYSYGHSQRVAEMVHDLALKIGLKGEELGMVYLAAQLHDIGKIGVPDEVLRKPGKLLLREWEQIRRHPEIGYTILSRSQRLERVAKRVLHHHERWDGKGYPAGLKGNDSPFGSRLIAVCDTIDAMTSDRPYRTAFSWPDCLSEIKNGKGTQFDPALVAAVENLWLEWERKYGK
jgi:HD-GYP domain-containing protein (c-di-GMP phosphodiesterase class II)